MLVITLNTFLHVVNGQCILSGAVAVHNFDVGHQVLRKSINEFWVGVDHGGQRGADLEDGALHHGRAGKPLELRRRVVHHIHRYSELENGESKTKET